MQIIDSRRLSTDENLWLKSLSDELNSWEVTRISEEITRQEKGARIAAYLNVITEANNESIQEAMEMGKRKQRLTFEQVMINCGLAAEWEAKGKAKGEAEGLAEGEAKGLAKGEAKGIAESKLEIARKMKEMGDSVERIHTITGLPPEVVVSC
jgi:predicted transposase YdaD